MVTLLRRREQQDICSSTIARRAVKGIPVLCLALFTLLFARARPNSNRPPHEKVLSNTTRLGGSTQHESSKPPSPLSPSKHRLDSLLPIDETTGKLVLPPHVSTVVIDVGAMNSDYLHALNTTGDNSTAIVLFEPLPANRAKLNETIQAGRLQNQAFLVQAALGETEHEAQFNVATGPSCGSLLGEGPSNFWCTKTKEVIPVQVYTLGDFMELMPPRSDGVRYHLKVDAEGADLLVVRGAGESVRRFDTIVVECQDVPSADDPRLHRKGAAYYAQVKEYLCDGHSFRGSSFDQIGKEDMQGNAMFWKTPVDQPIRLTPVLSGSAMKTRYGQLAAMAAS